MTKQHPERWLERPAGGDAPEDRVAALMRAGTPPEGLAPAARARVWARLDGGARRWRPVVAVRWGVATLLLFASAGVIAGVTTRRWRPALAPREGAPVPAKVGAPRARRAELARVETEAAPAAPLAARPAATPATPPSAELTARSTATPATPVRAPHARLANAARTAPAPDVVAAEPPATRATVATEPAPAAAPPSALASETPLLGEALTRLRQRRDAGGALAALDAYDARFPHGTLRREADGARVDALLMLGREGDALAVLRRLTLQPRARDQELRVIRAELASATSCDEAVDDFDRVLVETPAPALAERALHGRATCLARLGDAPAAARDLRDYLRRFPEGRFAAEARRALDANNL